MALTHNFTQEKREVAEFIVQQHAIGFSREEVLDSCRRRFSGYEYYRERDEIIKAVNWIFDRLPR